MEYFPLAVSVRCPKKTRVTLNLGQTVMTRNLIMTSGYYAQELRRHNNMRRSNDLCKYNTNADVLQPLSVESDIMGSW